MAPESDGLSLQTCVPHVAPSDCSESLASALRLICAAVKHRGGGVVLVVEIKRVVVAQRERDIAEDNLTSRDPALDLRRDAPTLAFAVQDSTNSHTRLDRVSGDPHPQIFALRCLAFAARVLSIRPADRKILFAPRCRRYERQNRRNQQSAAALL